MFKRFFVFAILAVMLILSGCGGGGSSVSQDDGLGGSTLPDHSRKEWNFIVYLNGESNLDPFTVADLNEMEQVGSTDKVRVLVLLDRVSTAAWSSTRLYYVTNDTDNSKIGSTLLVDYGEKDMADPNTLKDFIVYCQQNFPANHTVLSIYAHGGGIWPRSATKGKKVKTKGMSWDNTSYTNNWDCLTSDKLTQALVQARATTGQKVDIFYFDSCLMQMMENAYALKDEVDYMVGSEEETWTLNNISSDYAQMLRNLNTVADNSQSARDYAISLVDVFHTLYVSRGKDSTCSAVDLANFNPLFSAFQTFAAKLNATTDLTHVKSAYDVTTHFGQVPSNGNPPYFHENRDLYDFADEISKQVADADLIAAANNLKAALEEVIIAHQETGVFTGTGSSPAYGLAILLPKASEWVDYSSGEGYAMVKLAQDTEWDEFIKRFIVVNP